MKKILMICAVAMAVLCAWAEYTDDCITFSSAASFTLKTNNGKKYWDGTLWTSTDKTNWTAWMGAEVSAVKTGGKYNLYVRGNANTIVTGPSSQLTGTDHYWVLTASGENKIACTGNIETLRGATGDAPATTPMSRMCYSCMFGGCTSLTSAPSLPATTLAGRCYEDMFAGCTSLTSAPELPATKLAAGCYYEMFASCTSLTSAPELPATTLADDCYEMMFYGCTSLTSVPELPATTLAYCCYGMMFYDCTSLTSVPELPATTLMDRCYSQMFCGCTSLAVNQSAPGKEWKIPVESTTALDWGSCMFEWTGGTLQGQPELNTTYYIKSASPEPTITGVRAQQRYPWNGKVDISYTVENAGTEELVLSVLAVDQTTGITNAAKAVTGETAYTSGLHKIVWDMAADGLTLVSTNVVFAVTYKEHVEPEGLYCVIDLSEGTSATSYPVTHFDAVPSGGWSDEYKTTKLVLRKIPAGTFTMGSSTDELGRQGDEVQHQVTMTKEHYIGVFPVTQRQWELVMGTRPSYFNNNACYASRPVEQVSYNMIRGSSSGTGWPNSSGVDSTSFLGVLRARSGLVLDLPTEAQWEYACRAGTTTALNNGKNLMSTEQDAEVDKVGRYWYNGGSSYPQSVDTRGATAKVGSYAPNAWGLYDMHGNVVEWCLDWYGSYSGDATDPKGSSSGSERVIRGGSWYIFAGYCRSAHRYAYPPAFGYNNIGFRLVRTLSEGAAAETTVKSDGAVVEGFSDPVRVDLTSGTRVAEPTEAITYSTEWSEDAGEGAVAVVSVNGQAISEASGSGTVDWTPEFNGTYVLTHKVMVGGEQIGETFSAKFKVTHLSGPEITDVTAQQRYPWNGMVDISYTVENVGAEEFVLFVSAVDQTTGITNVAKAVTGDIAYTNGQHHIVWDMAADGLTFVSTNVVFSVSYAEPLRYCVIDLSGGTSASSYPISYLTDVPEGGWSDDFKTTKLVLRKISAGTFTMGSPGDESGHFSDETQHQVTLTKDTWMGVFEVTQRQWELVMGMRPSYFNNDVYYAPRPVEQVSYDMIRGSSAGAGWPNSSDVDSTSFLGVLRAKSGLVLDLPTEAQWEYACRAGTATALNSGKNLTSLTQDPEMDKVGRYRSNGGSSSSQSCDWSAGTAKAGSFAPNAWGLYDMHGNVWELCLDWKGRYSGDASDPKGPSSGSDRVVRGGCWVHYASSCRSAFRGTGNPSHVDSGVGFRLVRALSNAVVDETAAMGGSSGAHGESDPVRIDLTPGTRTTDTTETLTYSTSWVEDAGEDAIVEIAANGVVFSTQLGSGTVEWKPKYDGTYELTHTVKTNGVAIGETLTATFVAEGVSPKRPVISPESGTTFDTSLTVSMTCESEDATIRYTLDGSEPTMASTAYKRKFKIYGITTVKAIAFWEDGTPSEMMVADYSKGYCAEPVVTAPSEFVGSKAKVVMDCATEGVTIYYTMDGTDPNLQSPVYSKPLIVTNDCTIKAYAEKFDFTPSEIVTFVITRQWGIGDTLGKPDHAFETGGDADFVRVVDKTAALGESMRSGVIEDNQRSVLMTTLIGPGTLKFKWKTSCEQDKEYEWDHAEFRVNGIIRGRLNGVSDWVEVSQYVGGKGTNTVTWTYVKDSEEFEGEDCLWVSEYVWESDYTETQTTGVPVPYLWMEEKCSDVVDEFESYEKVAKQKALNKRLTVEQCYVAGVDPESLTQDFTTSISMEGGFPTVTWDPDLGILREYKVWGRESLMSGDWQCPTNSLHRFFKVTVEMK